MTDSPSSPVPADVVTLDGLTSDGVTSDGDGDPPGLVMRNLAEVFSAKLGDFDPDAPLTAQLLAGGRSNVTYLLRQAANAWVLRRPPLAHVMPSAHDMAREFRVLDGLTRARFPVPRPLLLVEDPQVIGAEFMVMQYVAGRVIGDAADASALSAAEADQVSSVMVAALAQLHEVDAVACGLDTLGRPEGYLRRQVARWAQNWQLSKTRELADVDRLVSWLDEQVAAVPADLPWSVVHGDFRLDNLILGAREPSILAVLDWEMSTLGDPIADLAVSLVYWTQAGDVLRQDVPVAQHVTDGPGFWTREQIVTAYAERTGRSLSHLDVCLALACLKLAVIMESIHYRTLQGAQLGTASTGAEMGMASAALASMGVRIANGGGLAALGA